jgi:hypothetical protein
VKEGDAFLLGVGFQVDEEVPADHEVEAGEGRVGEDVLFCEHDKLPYISLLMVSEDASSEGIKNVAR